MTTIQQSCTDSSSGAFAERAWIAVETPDETDAWIEQFNNELQQACSKNADAGVGICFRLAHGGEIYLHTAEDAILLDVTPDAEWAVPAITAATRMVTPRSNIWALPSDKLTQLIFGLNRLITSSRIVSRHRYK